mgnify:CR=1 FL=1
MFVFLFEVVIGEVDRLLHVVHVHVVHVHVLQYMYHMYIYYMLTTQFLLIFNFETKHGPNQTNAWGND